jgi:hypothetical protein
VSSVTRSFATSIEMVCNSQVSLVCRE